MADIAANLIKQNEGLRLLPYECTEGKITIGYGRNLEDKGISKYEAELMLAFDIEECQKDLEKLDFFEDLNLVRQAVLFDMRYQLGNKGLMGFKKMLSALEREDYEEAATQLLDSRYAIQTPNRAKANAKYMRDGSFNG